MNSTLFPLRIKLKNIFFPDPTQLSHTLLFDAGSIVEFMIFKANEILSHLLRAPPSFLL